MNRREDRKGARDARKPENPVLFRPPCAPRALAVSSGILSSLRCSQKAAQARDLPGPAPEAVEPNHPPRRHE